MQAHPISPSRAQPRLQPQHQEAQVGERDLHVRVASCRGEEMNRSHCRCLRTGADDLEKRAS